MQCKINFIKKLDDEIPHRAEILEAGCGTGQLSIALSRFGRRIHGRFIKRKFK